MMYIELVVLQWSLQWTIRALFFILKILIGLACLPLKIQAAKCLVKNTRDAVVYVVVIARRIA